MSTDFQTIDTNELDNVTGGGGRGEIIKKGAQWAWRNVIAPLGGGAAWEAASRWMGGGNQQPPQQPQPQPPQR